MPSNLPHNPTTTAHDVHRLDPLLFGKFPIKNMAIASGGDLLAIGDSFKEVLAAAAGSTDRVIAEGTLSHHATNGLTMTAGSSANNAAVISSLNKFPLGGNRFAVQCSINIDSIADNDNAVFIGFANAGRDGDALVDFDASPTPDVEITLAAGSFGLWIPADSGGSGSLYFAERKDGSDDPADISTTDTGVDAVAGTALKVGMLCDGSVIKVYAGVDSDGILVKKLEVSYPAVAQGYFVAMTKAQSTGAPVLSLGKLLAAGVVQ
tara:strand:+ start:2090 stop:2881 length:792 start_codon:yes stop_codon:yes gene_type:complete